MKSSAQQQARQSKNEPSGKRVDAHPGRARAIHSAALRLERRATPGHLGSGGNALGGDQGDVVVLLVRAELTELIDDGGA
jgi:hypothetical protein